MTGNNSARNWTLGGVAAVVAVLAFVFGVPGNVLNAWQLMDRFTGGDTTPTTTTSSSSSAPPTVQPSTSSSEPSSPPIQPDVTDPFTAPTQNDDPPPDAPPPVTTSQAPPPIPVVDRIQIDTWAYQKAGLNTYHASNNGSLSIRVDFKATANGYEVNGACASTVRIQGPDTDQAQDSSNCNSSKWMDVRQPGNYRVTVTAHQDSGAEHEDSIDVTVLPG